MPAGLSLTKGDRLRGKEEEQMIFGKTDPKDPVDLKSNGMPAAAATMATAPMPGTPAAAPTPAATQQPKATFRYVDQPDTAETFADSITGLFFDGQTLRIEFAVTRVDDVKPNSPITGRRYPICRLVLPPTAAVDLINRMQQVGAALTQAGMAKQTSPAQPAAAPAKAP
jgi:hypothetical protein